MSQYDVMRQLLPPGTAFNLENESFHRMLKKVSLIFDDSKDLIESLFKETPGKFEATLPLWCRLFQIPYDKTHHKDLNKQIIARLTAQGGQNLEYLYGQLKPFLSEGESLIIKAFPESLKIHLYGVNKAAKCRAGSRCGSKLQTYERNEKIVKRCQEIRHAEIEARYYGQN